MIIFWHKNRGFPILGKPSFLLRFLFNYSPYLSRYFLKNTSLSGNTFIIFSVTDSESLFILVMQYPICPAISSKLIPSPSFLKSKNMDSSGVKLHSFLKSSNSHLTNPSTSFLSSSSCHRYFLFFLVPLVLPFFLLLIFCPIMHITFNLFVVIIISFTVL